MAVETEAQAPARPRGRPRKTADERDDGNRRRALLQAAARLFHRQGFHGASTRDIAAAVGMQSGSPFYHFDSKSNLLFAVMEEGMRSALARQSRVLQKTEQTIEDPRSLLAHLIRNHFGVLLGPGSDFIPVMLYESRSLTGPQRQAIAALQAEYEAPWLPALSRLHAQGRLRGDIKLARLLIFGALNWAAQWYRPSRTGATLDELTQAAMDLFLQEGSCRFSGGS